jgi:hypothetical protein
MSTAFIPFNQPTSLGLEQSASVFLIGHDDILAGYDEPTEDQQADLEEVVDDAVNAARSKTFLLNSDHFLDLHLYLVAGGALPADEEQFEAEYPKELLKEFFEKVPTLYSVGEASLRSSETAR